MMEILSAKDIASYLNINEKKVYQLVKDNEIPFTRIGGKLVFSREIIDRWIRENTASEQNILIAGSDDVLLKVIIDNYNKTSKNTVFYASVGSINGLQLLKMGRAAVCCVHILDLEGKHSHWYLDRYLNREEFVVLKLFTREQGLFLPPDNPHKIKNFKDIFDRKLKFATRNKGSGTRILIDFLMKENGLVVDDRQNCIEAQSHISAGSKVCSEEADASFGIRHVAEILNLHYIPVFNEPFDMIIPVDLWETHKIRELINFFDPASLNNQSGKFAGYDYSTMGSISWKPQSLK
ncbi:MAG: helix-turn-helix transcriptional regulator [Candidatus Riflebacteria bacterium]|nr:helix-turn-helix transcriptional regulator [Candidatus Riflebacteria bacterium]